MQIDRLQPGNMRGHAGQKIAEFCDFLKASNGVFRSDIPFFKECVLFEPKADGIHLPKFEYLGPQSYINQVMQGGWGKDYAASVRAADPRYERLTAGAFVEANEGFTVTEQVRMEVTPPCAIKPLYVSYYRVVKSLLLPPISRVEPRYLTVSLTVQTDDLVQHILRERGRFLDA